LIELILLFIMSWSAMDAADILEADIIKLEKETEEIRILYDDAFLEWEKITNETQKAWKTKEQLRKELNRMDKDHDRWSILFNMATKANENYRSLKSEVIELKEISDDINFKLDKKELELKLKQDTLSKLEKISPARQRYNNVGITLSQNCINQIEAGISNKCPTYYELFVLYDNSNPIISGEFVETTHDIKRGKSPVQNHWKFYEQWPGWVILMVDPDTEFINRNYSIIIQSNEFTSLSLYGNIKLGSFDGIINTYSNVKFSTDCKTTIVAPDMELITRVLSYVITGCDGEFKMDPRITNSGKYEMREYGSPHKLYEEWLEKNSDWHQKYARMS